MRFPFRSRPYVSIVFSSAPNPLSFPGRYFIAEPGLAPITKSIQIVIVLLIVGLVRRSPSSHQSLSRTFYENPGNLVSRSVRWPKCITQKIMSSSKSYFGTRRLRRSKQKKKTIGKYWPELLGLWTVLEP